MPLRRKQTNHLVRGSDSKIEPYQLEAIFQQEVFNPEISRIFSPSTWADWTLMERQGHGSLHLLCYPERGLMRQRKPREVKGLAQGPIAKQHWRLNLNPPPLTSKFRLFFTVEAYQWSRTNTVGERPFIFYFILEKLPFHHTVLQMDLSMQISEKMNRSPGSHTHSFCEFLLLEQVC